MQIFGEEIPKTLRGINDVMHQHPITASKIKKVEVKNLKHSRKCIEYN